MNRLIAAAWIALGLVAIAAVTVSALAVVGGVLVWIWTQETVALKVAGTGAVVGAVLLFVSARLDSDV